MKEVVKVIVGFAVATIAWTMSDHIIDRIAGGEEA